MIRPLPFVLAAAIAPIYAIAQTPLDFKGLQLGSPIAALNQTKRFICKPNATDDGDTVCTLRPGQTETVAKENVRRIDLFYFDRSLAIIRMYMKLEAAPSVLEALRERYGPPAHSDVSTSNIKTSRYTWAKGRSEISTSMIVARDLSYTLIEYQFSRDSPEAERRIEEMKKRAAKDL